MLCGFCSRGDESAQCWAFSRALFDRSLKVKEVKDVKHFSKSLELCGRGEGGVFFFSNFFLKNINMVNLPNGHHAPRETTHQNDETERSPWAARADFERFGSTSDRHDGSGIIINLPNGSITPSRTREMTRNKEKSSPADKGFGKHHTIELVRVSSSGAARPITISDRSPVIILFIGGFGDDGKMAMERQR